MVGRGKALFPVVDLFAGPGGLGEGFASLLDDRGRKRFESAICIERDESSHQTLLLRHFFRQFPAGEAPEEYYKYLAGDISKRELLETYPVQAARASKSALCISLGPESHTQVTRLIRSRLAGAKRWALVGGPPCQAYSLVGRSRMKGDPDFETDERHFLYREYLKIIADHRPPVFVMENVKGLLSAKVDGEGMFARILKDLRNPRNGKSVGNLYDLYSLSERVDGAEIDPRAFLVYAERYGVPQARHRLFILGVRKDLGVIPDQLALEKAPTLHQTIGSLPRLRSGITRAADGYQEWLGALSPVASLRSRRTSGGDAIPESVMSRIRDTIAAHSGPRDRASMRYPARQNAKHNAIAQLYDSRLTALANHETRGHMPSDLRRYLYASSFASELGRSPKLADFPVSLLPDHANVADGRDGLMFSDRFRVQIATAVATTITSHISKDGHYFIHYDPRQCRSLTVREAARIQTFPDNYLFEGNRTSQYHQIGNAVPPYLASKIAEIVAVLLERVKV